MNAHSAHLSNKVLSLQEKALVLAMFAAQVTVNNNTRTAHCFCTWGFVALLLPCYISEGLLSKRSSRTSATLTVISRDGSRFDTSPLDGASATFTELGTRSYQARMLESHSQDNTR